MVDFRASRLYLSDEGSVLSSAGVCVNVFDDIKAYGHGRHGYRPSSPQCLRLQLRESLVVHHEQLLPVQLDMSAKGRQQEIQNALAQWDTVRFSPITIKFSPPAFCHIKLVVVVKYVK